MRGHTSCHFPLFFSFFFFCILRSVQHKLFSLCLFLIKHSVPRSEEAVLFLCFLIKTCRSVRFLACRFQGHSDYSLKVYCVVWQTRDRLLWPWPAAASCQDIDFTLQKATRISTEQLYIRALFYPLHFVELQVFPFNASAPRGSEYFHLPLHNLPSYKNFSFFPYKRIPADKIISSTPFTRLQPRLYGRLIYIARKIA